MASDRHFPAQSIHSVLRFISHQSIPARQSNRIAVMKRNQRSLGESDFGLFFLCTKQAAPEVLASFLEDAFRPRRCCLEQLFQGTFPTQAQAQT
jgi:hypothetical protein